jgi:pilus assembly protein CpaB
MMALVFGATATFTALGWLKNQPAQQTQEAIKMGPVVVAAKEIGSATSLTADQLVVRRWPLENRPQGSYTKAEDLVGRVVAFPMTAGEPILETKLAPQGVPPGLVALLSPEKRAMTVKVDEASGVAGFLSPDNRVDVLVTVDKGDFNKDPISKVILQNLRVLGVGQRIDRSNGDKPQVVPTVTMEASLEDCERLALADKEGRISLILRPQKEEAQVATGGMRTSELLGHAAAMAPLPRAAEVQGASVTPPPPRHSVEVIKGNKRESLEF